MHRVSRSLLLGRLWGIYLTFSCITTIWMLVVLEGSVAKGQPFGTRQQIEQAIQDAHRDSDLRNIQIRLDRLESINIAIRIDRLELMMDLHNRIAVILGVPFLFLLAKELLIYLRHKTP